MKTINLIFVKEVKNFLKRKHMIKWFVILVSMTLLLQFTLIPDFVEKYVDKHTFVILGIVFLSNLMPINMALDLVTGEKFHKTLETLITLPLSVGDIFLGKILFGVCVSISGFILMLLINNITIDLVTGSSFIEYFGSETVLITFITVVLLHFLIELIASVLSLIYVNYKIIGYIVTLIEILFVVIYAKIMIDDILWVQLFYIAFLASAVFTLIYSLYKKIDKHLILKYIK